VTATYTLDYAIDGAAAECMDGYGAWRRALPEPPDYPHMHQRRSPAGGLHMRAGVMYRATPRLLSHRPPLACVSRPLLGWCPSPMALERGLAPPTWDGAGLIYLRAAEAGREIDLPPDAHILSAIGLLTGADAAAGCAAALRRASLIAPAEQVVAAGLRGPDTLCRVLQDIHGAAPSWVAAMPRQPEGHLHPARDLVWVLACGLAVCRGLPLPPPPPDQGATP
jgi:hypothetical protein